MKLRTKSNSIAQTQISTPQTANKPTTQASNSNSSHLSFTQRVTATTLALATGTTALLSASGQAVAQNRIVKTRDVDCVIFEGKNLVFQYPFLRVRAKARFKYWEENGIRRFFEGPTQTWDSWTGITDTIVYRELKNLSITGQLDEVDAQGAKKAKVSAAGTLVMKIQVPGLGSLFEVNQPVSCSASKRVYDW